MPHIFRISFVNQGKVYELYAENVCHSEIYGFVEVEGLLFGEASAVLIDPVEERLKTEFAGVSRTLVPMHAVIRIDEVEKKGTCKIRDLDRAANITPFPGLAYPADKRSDS